MDFDLTIFVSALSSPALIKGAALTLVLTLVAHALAIAISLPMAVMLRGTSRIGRNVIKAYIVLFRAVPLLLLLLLIWNGLPQINPVFREKWFTPFLAALIGLALIEAAYQIEINRAALSAIDKGQIDAGNALGLTPFQIFILVQLPQALRIALPPTVNEFITLLKSTSIATVISLRELMTVTQQAVAFSYRFAEYYSAALIYYVAMVLVLMMVQAAAERRMRWIGK
ncbi:MAG: amino acid ABC transporter permease [Hyphomicrobiales bacterium]|nr:amino acid ABC transporter permease [Hyphomicrobiales bacterium]